MEQDRLIDLFGDLPALRWLEEVAERAFRFCGCGRGGEDEEPHGFLEALEEFGGGGREGREVLVGEFESAFGVFFCGRGEVCADHFD